MMNRTSRAAVLVAPRRFEMRTFDVPILESLGAVIRIEASGICGTDVEQFDGIMSADARRTPMPAIPGHEPVGRVVDIAPNTARLWGVAVGDLVTARAAWGCGECDACAQQQPERCKSRGGTYGFVDVSKAPHLWGGFADHQYLHHLSVVRKIPDHVSARLATLVNPLACGISWGSRVPKTGPGDAVVVLGAGQRGLCSVAAARAAGAATIVVTGLPQDGYKLAEALRLGADAVLKVGSDEQETAAELVDLTDGGADVVVDTTPFYDGALGLAAGIARQGGRIVSAGIKGRRTATQLFQDDLTFKELCVMGVSAPGPEDFSAAVDLLGEQVEMFAPLHTHSFGLNDVVQALEVAAGRVPGTQAIHVSLEPVLDA